MQARRGPRVRRRRSRHPRGRQGRRAVHRPRGQGARRLRGEQTLLDLGPGEHVGEMALIRSVPRSASVHAAGCPAELIAIRRQDFFEILRKEHEVAVKMLWQFLGVFADRLDQTSSALHNAKRELAAEDMTAEIFPEIDTETESLPHRASRGERGLASRLSRQRSLSPPRARRRRPPRRTRRRALSPWRPSTPPPSSSAAPARRPRHMEHWERPAPRRSGSPAGPSRSTGPCEPRAPWTPAARCPSRARSPPRRG